MRQEPEFFEDRPMGLVYIGKKLDESLAIELVLDEAGLDYAVEVDYYTGGIIFRRERAGAFFYVEDADFARAAAALKSKGYTPQDPPPSPPSELAAPTTTG